MSVLLSNLLVSLSESSLDSMTTSQDAAWQAAASDSDSACDKEPLGQGELAEQLPGLEEHPERPLSQSELSDFVTEGFVLLKGKCIGAPVTETTHSFPPNPYAFVR